MPSDVFATSTGIAGFGVFDVSTTVYGPFALVRDAREQERRVALEVDEAAEREHDVLRGQRRAVGELDVLAELEGVRLRVGSTP